MKMKFNISLAFILFLFSSTNLRSQEIDIYQEMHPILLEITHLADYGICKKEKMEMAIEILNAKSSHFQSTNKKALIAKDSFDPMKFGLKLASYYDEESDLLIQLVEGGNDSINALWSNINKIEGWTGYQTLRQKFVYIKRDSIEHSLLGSMFLANEAIISISKPLDFTINSRASGIAIEQRLGLKTSFNKILDICQVLNRNMAPKNTLLYLKSDEPLSSVERVVGFTQFWTEVKYNFAFFDQVPNLDWDGVYIDYLPLFMEDQTNSEYFKKLEKVCALLQDGHTNIYSPSNLESDHPKLSLLNIGGKAIVQNMSVELKNEIPKGTEVIAVDGTAVKTYMEKYITPYISSSTQHILMNESIRKMLQGEPNSMVELKFRDREGKTWTQNLKRSRDKQQIDWAHEWPNRQIVELKDLGDQTALIALNRFDTRKVVEDFEKILDTLQHFEHFIIDLRYNGGGNSGNGYDILKYFADKPFRTSNWKTREHKGAYKAWGGQFKNTNDEELDEWALEAKQTYLGKYWHVGEPDTIQPQKKLDFKGDLIVLISNNTASSAEDFLIALDDLGFGKIIGQASYGSTGQPMFVKLPRGGNARICTKKDTYPDGREFVGFGIQPDIFVEKTVEDFLSGRDAELEKALSIIK